MIPALRSLGRASRVVFPVSFATLLLSHAGWLNGCETASLDVALRVHPMVETEQVVLVTITDHDYEVLFEETSPLRRDRVGSLLVAIARGNPAVVAVDLEMDPLEVDALPPDGETVRWPPVIWALPGEVHENGAFLPQEGIDVAGAPFGVALVPEDRDGMVRRYQRTFDLMPGSLGSLPWVVVRKFCQVDPTAAESCPKLLALPANSEDELLLNFAGDRFEFPRISASDLLLAAEGPGWSREGPLRGKIVLLGGHYRAARDFHATPVGRLSGVELIGQAVESELQGRGIRVTHEALMVLLDVLCGFAVAFIHHRFPVRMATALTIFAFPVLCLLSSWLVFLSFSRWANYVPVCLSVLISELYEDAKKASDMEARLREKTGDTAGLPEDEAPEASEPPSREETTAADAGPGEQ